MVQSALSDSASYLSVDETSVHDFHCEHKHQLCGPSQSWVDDRPMTTLASFLGWADLRKACCCRPYGACCTPPSRVVHRICRLWPKNQVFSFRKYPNNATIRGEMESSPGGVVVAKRSLAEGRQLIVSVSNARHTQCSWTMHLRLPLA